MRKRIWIPSVAVLALCFYLLLHRANKAPVADNLQPTPVAITNENNSVPAPEPLVIVHTPVGSAPVPAPFKQPTRNLPGILNSAKEELFQMPIDFYGRVLDEKSNSVAGAKIQLSWDDQAAENWKRSMETESDAAGLFSLHGKRGATLEVSVSKEGYYTPSNGKGFFHYAFGNPNFSSTPDDPVVFHLRKKGKGASLAGSKFPPGMRIAQLHHDGTPVELDLFNGTQVSAGNGQLKLELWRDLSDRKAEVFNWKLQLTVAGGGLIPTTEEFAFEAPETGYQPVTVVDMQATNPNWLGELRCKYYIQLANGNYGRIDFYLLPYNGAFTVQSAINPTGSRDLEPAE